MTSILSRPPALKRSEELHREVRAFADECASGDRSASGNRIRELEVGRFEDLALKIARYQRDLCPGFARMVRSTSKDLVELSEIPLVPTEAFRLTRVAAHPEDLDQVVYETSGTTTGECGRHPVRDLRTKEHLSLLQARRTLFSQDRRGVVIALGQVEGNVPRSSLTHLMELLMEHFDGRALSVQPEGAAFKARDPARFLVTSTGVDVDALERACRIAKARSEPLFLLCTGFALASLLEVLEGRTVKTPARTRLMLTGGFKGRYRELDERELRKRAARALSLSPGSIVGEYGMTELTSQLFEDQETGLYQAPPWLRVRAIEPHTFRVLPDGQEGLAHFLDLGNVDSSISVLTQDICTTQGTCVRLLGRAPRSEARGCSLPYESSLIASEKRHTDD